MSDVLPFTRPARQSQPWPDTVTVVAWHDPVIEHAPGAIATTSDDFLTTGRVHVFDSGECRSTGRWS
jgi:hypothetical protein